MACKANDYIESLDPGLLTYKEELFIYSVTSDATLRFLRPREVQAMKIPDVYKRLLVDKIINLQTPERKRRMKDELLAEESAQHPKKLKGETPIECLFTPKVKENGSGYLDRELARLTDEQGSLTLLVLHKKNELEDMKSVPSQTKPLSIPGGTVTKTVCDNCHHRGHKAHGNRGNKSCPYGPCDGFQFCGLLSKHKDHKQEIIQAEKEIAELEKEIRGNSEAQKNIRGFLSNDSTNFVSTMRVQLKSSFPTRYSSKDGAQKLQKDLRYIKIATGGKIPDNIDKLGQDQLEKLISGGKLKVYSKCGEMDDDYCHDLNTPGSIRPAASSSPAISNMNMGIFPPPIPWMNGMILPSMSKLSAYSSASAPPPLYTDSALISPYGQSCCPSYVPMYPPPFPPMPPPTCTITSAVPSEKSDVFPPLPLEEYPSPPPKF